MNGELAQLIALVAHGNRFLLGRGGIDEAFEATNSTFRFVSQLEFRFGADTIGPRVVDWLRWLESVGSESLSLDLSGPPLGSRGEAHPGELRVPDRTLAGFSNSAPGLVRSTGKSSEVWISNWRVRDAGEERSWSVGYFGQKSVRGRVFAHAAASEALDAALLRAESFATEMELEPWPNVFARARMTLQEGGDPPYYPDMLPSGYDNAESRRLLAGAASAFVFGGMGSWNDLYLDDEDLRARYEDVSESLYRAVLSAIEAGVNGFV